ncbi:hypothetical protein FDI40_gp528 [Agrobacterium phage Atu_ph07]|uniref:Uncharacterized protein n=1 Tax=Agrobacterium phage Atu_ph07 TaxID=2024264 RepID=A0A2L0V0H6_9CAUD|nr:hypothetical protein FDI40_gp528 [Agrobacterium phage Atu_ph07]AUZ95287.1 hypothetical protein [Agrobacterium phage Atu_ph07]
MTDGLTAGKLIEMLQTIDPDTPVHFHHGGGDFPRMIQDPENKHPYSKMFGYIELAQSKSDESFFVTTSDSFYKKIKKNCHKPFKALVVM